MAISILRHVGTSIKTSGWYTIMTDECSDVSNKGQFVICIRWIDLEQLCEHEDVIGLYHVDAIDAKTLVAAIEDVILRLGLNFAQCRGQCYEGASNMTGSRGGVAAQIREKQPKALLTHCYGHALNLAVGDCIKQSKIFRDALDVAFEVAKLIRFSPKRNAEFDNIFVENYMEDNRDAPSHSIRALCPTRWTVHGNVLESILDHWSVLCQLWEQCLDTRLVLDVKARIIGVKSQMTSFGLLFGMHLSKTILKHTDNLSRTLQKQSMSSAECQGIAELTVSTLQRMRSDEAFDQFFSVVEISRESLGADTPSLPRKKRARIEVGTGAGSHAESVEDYYRQKYYEALDMCVESIKDRFNQPGYQLYRNLEEVLVMAANGKAYDKQLDAIRDFYGDDFNSSTFFHFLHSLKGSARF